jgi:SiaC family regulatory phosphoprotein
MNNLAISSSQETPLVNFNTNGELSISGISIPENVNNFYKPIFDWLIDFINTKPQQINFTLDIEYMNTSSTRVVLQLLNKLKTIELEGIIIQIIWKFDADDADMQELGEDLQDSSKIKFHFSPKLI